MIDQHLRLTSHALQDRHRRPAERRGAVETDRDGAQLIAARGERDHGERVELGLLEHVHLLAGGGVVAAEDDGLSREQIRVPALVAVGPAGEPGRDVGGRAVIRERHEGPALPAPQIDGATVAGHELDREPAEAAEHLVKVQRLARLLGHLHQGIGDALLALQALEELADVSRFH